MPDVLYPAEWVIRIFLGKYPKLNLSEQVQGKHILEVSCGDGRNFGPLFQKGMQVTATEVSQKIVTSLRTRYPNVQIELGLNGDLPFSDASFDLLLSWNQIYYMGQNPKDLDFGKHVTELARVLKPGGVLISSIPMSDSFIYENAVRITNEYCKIDSDPFGGVRNGEIMRRFASEEEIEVTYQKEFKNFVFATSRNDHFGITNNWHIFVCEVR